MSLHNWLQHLRAALVPRWGQRHDRRRGWLRAATHRPNLEVLEDRITPSFLWPAATSAAVLSEAPPGVVWSPLGRQFADITSDSILDQIALGYHSVGGYFVSDVVVWPGRGDGTFGDRIVSPIGGYASYIGFAVADFNGDGRLDVFTASPTPASGLDAPDPAFGAALLGRGDGSFDLEGFYSLVGISAGIVWPTGIGTGDISGTGRVDVVVAGSVDNPWNADTFVVLFNDGNWPPPPPPPPPSIRIGDANITEGHAGTAAASFTVTLSAPSTEAITVAYATADGTATAGSDYQAAPGTLTIPAGQTTGTITVLVNGDRLGEPNETFFVNLGNPTNATLADGQGVGTIVDDEPRISISDVSRKEGQKNQTTLFTFTVTLSDAYDQPVTMSFRTADGTARTSDQDYVARTGTLTFAPGETTRTITIEVKGDSKREASDTFYLDLFGLSSNALFTKSRGLGTILNDD
jgi:hypothetical protein